jgi:hypothetical protein
MLDADGGFKEYVDDGHEMKPMALAFQWLCIEVCQLSLTAIGSPIL